MNENRSKNVLNYDFHGMEEKNQSDLKSNSCKLLMTAPLKPRYEMLKYFMSVADHKGLGAKNALKL